MLHLGRAVRAEVPRCRRDVATESPARREARYLRRAVAAEVEGERLVAEPGKPRAVVRPLAHRAVALVREHDPDAARAEQVPGEPDPVGGAERDIATGRSATVDRAARRRAGQGDHREQRGHERRELLPRGRRPRERRSDASDRTVEK